ncbi:hypothetical protein [Treponema sp.]|uniref:hypothetical protein n=1 Tax=Treponema sp. TaxID=166 RepID=UPI00298DACBD|nr:hypothetical protein [Treponema sp.]MCQ2240084.1 hypothetical protein [Treponema sp.]
MKILTNKIMAASAAILVLGLVFTGCGNGVSLLLTTEKNEGIVYAGSMADHKYGYGIGEDGHATYTEDGGRTWQVSGNKAAPLFSLSAINDRVCFATGEHKAFLKTDDGGRTWKSLKGHLGKRSKGCSFRNEEFGTVWTSGNAFEYSAANDDWTAIGNPKGCGLIESVYAMAPGKFFLCGSNGTIYSTNDYGKNWEECQKIFDKEDEIKPVTGQWIKTSEFDFRNNVLRFAYLAEQNYVYSMIIWKSLDEGKTWTKESVTKLPNLAKALAINCNGGISIFNTDSTMNYYVMK